MIEAFLPPIRVAGRAIERGTIRHAAANDARGPAALRRVRVAWIGAPNVRMERTQRTIWIVVKVEIVGVGIRRIRQWLSGLRVAAGPAAHHLRLQLIASQRMTGSGRRVHGLTERLFKRSDVLPQLAYHEKASVLEQRLDSIGCFAQGARLVGEIWIAAQELTKMDLIGEAIARLAFA